MACPTGFEPARFGVGVIRHSAEFVDSDAVSAICLIFVIAYAQSLQPVDTTGFAGFSRVFENSSLIVVRRLPTNFSGPAQQSCWVTYSHRLHRWPLAYEAPEIFWSWISFSFCPTKRTTFRMDYRTLQDKLRLLLVAIRKNVQPRNTQYTTCMLENTMI